MKGKFYKLFYYTLVIFCLQGAGAYAQTVIFQSGFETTDPIFTYSCGSCTGGLANGTTNPRTGTNAGFINGGGTKSYDGSIITGTALTLTAGKYYTVQVWARVAVCTGSLDIRKSVTATNAAMVAATGADIILNGTTNVTTTAYSLYTATFAQAANETKYVGFQMNSAGGGPCSNLAQYIDDIVITEYDAPPCAIYCAAGNATAATSFVTNVTFNGINRTSGWDGYVCTGQATSVRRTLAYNLTVTASNNSVSQKVVAAWIDWNRDGVYADPAERVLGTTDITTATPPTSPATLASVTVPAGATLGLTKMRVAMVIGTVAQTTPCNTVQLADYEDYDINVLPAPVNMVYSATTVTQITNSVNAGSTKNEVLQINIKTTGQLSAPSATQLVLTTLGTTNIADITDARIYFTGSSTVFSSASQLGATIAVPPADPATMTFNFSKVLSEGDNYFWIAYDVIPTAPGGNVIDAKLVNTTVGGTTYALNATPAGSRPIIASYPMTYVSSTVIQNTNPVPLASTLNDVIRIEVNADGAINPLSVTALTFRTNGTTNFGDIQNARVFFTEDNPVFSTAVQFGSTLAVPPGFNVDFVINGSATLISGTNYFWLTYDVKATAACNPAQIDALCNNIALSSGNQVPFPTAPAGARVINCGTAYYSQCTCDFNNPANWNTQRNGSGTALANTAAFAVAANSFYVQNSHTMTSSAALTVSELYLEPGSYVLANHLITLTKLYIQSFATFEQTYSQTSGVIGGTYIGNFYIKKDGTWKHNNVGYLPGTSGTQYFEPYSIQWFLGVGAGTFPGGTNWGTVILDIPSAPNLIINALSLSYIHGDLMIRKWGGAANYFYINMDNPITIDGDLIVSGAVSKGIAGFSCNILGCTCNAAAVGVPVNVAGDFIMSGGTWNDFNCGSNASTGMAMSVGGDVIITGGVIKMNNNAGSKLDLIPVTVSSTWTQTGGTVTLGNTNVKAGKTKTLTGSKIGDVTTPSTLIVETGAQLYTSNYPVTGTGNFTLQTGAWLGIGSIAGITSVGATGNVQVSGTRSYNSGATYEYYEGLTPQATGNFLTTTTTGLYPSQVANLIINKNLPANIVNLTNTTDVNGTLTLTNGVLTTSFTSATAPWVRIPLAATVSPVGGSANSYVDGYIRRQGNTAFTMPTGNAGRWRRIAFTAPSINTEFEARYVAAPYVNTTTMAPAPLTVLDHVSKLEHWYLVKPLGNDAATTKVKLHWEDASLSGVYKFDSLGVARWSGSAWENANCYGTCPPNWTSSTTERTYTGIASGTGIGTIQSNTVSAFGPFTLSSIGVFPLNPLPVELLNFEGVCNGSQTELRWSTASEKNNEFFTIEKCNDGKSFMPFGRVEGAGNSTSLRNYIFIDDNPFLGDNYYRLMQTDYDGRSESSQPIYVKCERYYETSISAYNNNSGELIVSLNVNTGSVYKIAIHDALGKLVIDEKIVVNEGYNEISIDISRLNPGIYFIRASDAEQSMNKKILIH